MVVPLLGLAAPIAAIRRSPDGGRTGPAPRSASDNGGSAAEDGGRRLFCFAMQSREIEDLANRPVASRRRKIAAARRCGPGPLAVRSPSGRPGGAVLSGKVGSPGTSAKEGLRTSSESSSKPRRVHRAQEPGHIFRGKLEAQGRAKMIDAKVAEVFIEIP